jgi:hypothetical protein
MTPKGIDGTLTSNSGADGNEHTEMLMARLDALLVAEGEAYVFVMQLVADGEPLIVRTLCEHLHQRPVTLTPVQEQTCPFEYYVEAYLERFAAKAAAVREWEQELRARLGSELGVQHYIVRVSPRGAGPTTWSIVDNLASDYGAGFRYPVGSERNVALGRVAENFVPSDES